MELIIFGIGAILASFLNALIYRIEKGLDLKTMLLTRSKCEHCKKELEWYELIPIFSWIFQQGKCGKCKKKIDIYYPISETLLGVSYIFIYQSTGNYFYMFLASILFMLVYSDIKNKSIPSGVTNFFVAVCLVYFLFNLVNYLSLAIFLLIAILILGISKIRYGKVEVIGFGDFLVVLGISMILSISSFISFFLITLYLSGIYSLIMIGLKKYDLKSTLPLLPFIFAGFILNFIFGEFLINWIIK